MAAADAEEATRLPGQLGVYQIADAEGAILYIGQAGGARRSACAASCSARRRNAARASQFRVEVNMQYRTRWFELLMVHKADHGSLPPDNAKNPPPALGGLSPASTNFPPHYMGSSEDGGVIATHTLPTPLGGRT